MEGARPSNAVAVAVVRAALNVLRRHRVNPAVVEVLVVDEAVVDVGKVLVAGVVAVAGLHLGRCASRFASRRRFFSR